MSCKGSLDMFLLGTSGDTDRTGDVHPLTSGRGCGDFPNTAYPAATGHPANPHPEHGEDLQLPAHHPTAECQQIQAHGKSLLPCSPVSLGDLRALN